MKRKLRTGFTTGTAAAAAAKGALLCLLDKQIPERVEIELLTGDSMAIAIHRCETGPPDTATCTVIKDAGDDPDITHGAEIGATVILREKGASPDGVEITGGQGVGMVTKPGLEVLPGNPAINPGPRRMITQSIETVLNNRGQSVHATVEVFVPMGKELTKKTLNERLGIKGGISILGTTGLVKPLSHDAYTATIESALAVAAAMHNAEVVLTTGRRSERYAQALWTGVPEEAFVQIGDHFETSIRSASQKRFEGVRLAVFFGKAVKMAHGVPCTHAAKSRLTLDRLAGWAESELNNSGLAEEIRHANTARHAFDFIHGKYPELIARVGKEMIKSAQGFSQRKMQIRSVIFDYQGKIAFDSGNTEPESREKW